MTDRKVLKKSVLLSILIGAFVCLVIILTGNLTGGISFASGILLLSLLTYFTERVVFLLLYEEKGKKWRVFMFMILLLIFVFAGVYLSFKINLNLFFLGLGVLTLVIFMSFMLMFFTQKQGKGEK